MKKDKAVFIVEGSITEEMQFDLSKKIDAVCKEFGLESYLDDVYSEDGIQIHDLAKARFLDVCEHNNTITNECSDCNENELTDYTNTSVDDNRTDTLIGAVLTHLLPDIRNVIIDFNISDRIQEIVAEWSKADFDKLMSINLEDDIHEQIFKSLSMDNFKELINKYKAEEEQC
jgi:hypothetical protein